MPSPSPQCERVTIRKEEADYELVFAIEEVTTDDRRGRLHYTVNPGPLCLPHGNPDGTGVNLCKPMDEAN